MVFGFLLGKERPEKRRKKAIAVLGIMMLRVYLVLSTTLL